MNPYKVSAQFAACTWFTNNNAGKPTSEEAMQFARDNWEAFLPCAHEGLGRLLIRIAGPRQKRYSKQPGRTRSQVLNLERADAG
jgi:hypothetical protein